MHEENEFWLHDHVIFPIGNASFIKDGWITNKNQYTEIFVRYRNKIELKEM